MNLNPETRASLLIRVRDPADRAAWHEFVEIYWPVIHRLARRKGIQEADADDIAQTVLVAVVKGLVHRDSKSAHILLEAGVDRGRSLRN